MSSDKSRCRKNAHPKGTCRLSAGGEERGQDPKRADKPRVRYEFCAPMSVKAAVRAGLGIGIVYQNAIATPLAKGSLRLVDVPELKEMGMKSVIAYDGRKPLSSIVQEFLTLLRKKTKHTEKFDKPISPLSTLTGRERKLSKLQRVSPKTPRKHPLPHHPSVVSVCSFRILLLSCSGFISLRVMPSA